MLNSNLANFFYGITETNKLMPDLTTAIGVTDKIGQTGIFKYKVICIKISYILSNCMLNMGQIY